MCIRDRFHGGATATDKTKKFTNFEDQLKQIRLSKDYLVNNPHLAQQVLFSEHEAAQK